CEGLPAFTSCGIPLDVNNIADVQCIALPTIALEVQRISELDSPVRHGSGRITNVNKEEGVGIDPVDASNRTLQFYSSGAVVRGSERSLRRCQPADKQSAGDDANASDFRFHRVQHQSLVTRKSPLTEPWRHVPMSLR